MMISISSTRNRAMKLATYAEECCEICQEIIHNHFVQCPSCGEASAPTSHYGEIWEMDIGDEIACEVCKARWRLASKSDADYQDWEWDFIQHGA